VTKDTTFLAWMTAITGLDYADPDPALHDPTGMIGSIDK
jgi:hypothetical protein